MIIWLIETIISKHVKRISNESRFTHCFVNNVNLYFLKLKEEITKSSS